MTTYSITERTIGQGGSGQVVCGVNDINNSVVAVKLVPLRNRHEILTFNNEVKVAQKIHNVHNQHLCEIYETYNTNNTGHLIMKKYCYDLFTLFFEHNVSFTEECTKRMFKGICIGLKNLHDRGIAHLDIKPENILLDENESPVLCDFGSSYISSTATAVAKGQRCFVRDLGVRGTLEYCAPEIFDKHKEYDPFRCDIFSLGILFYVILTRSFPYGEDRVMDTSKGRKILSPLCMDMLERMLETNPDNRIPINSLLRHEWFGTERYHRSILSSVQRLLKL